jgi:hypothetical protein
VESSTAYLTHRRVPSQASPSEISIYVQQVADSVSPVNFCKGHLQLWGVLLSQGRVAFANVSLIAEYAPSMLNVRQQDLLPPSSSADPESDMGHSDNDREETSFVQFKVPPFSTSRVHGNSLYYDFMPGEKNKGQHDCSRGQLSECSGKRSQGQDTIRESLSAGREPLRRGPSSSAVGTGAGTANNALQDDLLKSVTLLVQMKTAAASGAPAMGGQANVSIPQQSASTPSSKLPVCLHGFSFKSLLTWERFRVTRPHLFSKGVPHSWPPDLKDNMLCVPVGTVVLQAHSFEVGVAAGFSWCQVEFIGSGATEISPTVGMQGWIFNQHDKRDFLTKIDAHERADIHEDCFG